MPPECVDKEQIGSLRELWIWVVGSRELASSLALSCDVTALRDGDWQSFLADGVSPAFLLVEPGGLGRDGGEGLADPGELELLLDGCERAAIPRLAWIRGVPADSLDMELLARFDRVFTVEHGQLPVLEAAGIAAPFLLWPATDLASSAMPSIDAAARPQPVLWLGGWRNDWSRDWRDRLTSVLRGAARRGLHIYENENGNEGAIPLPDELREFVRGAVAAEDRSALLRDARIVIGADPLVGRPSLAPEIVFDAIASGAAVLTPHDFMSMHDFGVGGSNTPWRNLVPVVHDGDIVVEEIDRLLEDDQLRQEVVEHAHRTVIHNHTYAHRLATLASAVGLRAVPCPF